jgi:hypothetical protein
MFVIRDIMYCKPDDAQRAQYDQQLAEAGAQPPQGQTPVDLSKYEKPPERQAAEPASAAQPQQEYMPPPPRHTVAPGARNFDTERAGRDQILRRAMAVRVQDLMEDMYGPLQTPAVKGFDIALVPTTKPRFLGSPPPRVLVNVVDNADAAAINDSWSTAARARIHVAKAPLIVLLFAKHIAPQGEISRALDQLERQRKAPDGPDELSVVVVDVNDWTARLPPNVSTATRKLVDRLRS